MTDMSKELGISIDMHQSGAPMVVEADEQGIRRSRLQMAEDMQAMGAGGYRDIYALSEAADAPVTEAEVGGTVAGFVPGKAAGLVGAPGDIAALATGLYKAAFPEPEQGRLDAFIQQVEEVSNKYGSGATLGFLDDWATESGIPDEVKQGFMQGAEVGSFFGFGQGAAATGKGAAAAGKAIAEGAPARIDEVVVGAKKALQKPTKENPVTAVAPTETEPGIIAFHGSGADFDEFKIEKVGTGVGHQAYGNGFYFSSSEKLAEGYKGDAGKLFMVNLGVKEKNLLDWQQPLKQQPEILKKIRTLIDDKDILKSFDYNVDKGIMGGNAYSNYIGKTKEETSKILKSVGIDGIKYLDIGSKGGGKTIADAPTNYVIFDDKAIKILEKYGIVGPVAITALGAAKQEGAKDANST